MPKIRFLHYTALEDIDTICKESERVKVSIEVYRTVTYADGTTQEEIIYSMGSTIKSSKDLIQFDEKEDMRVLSRETRRKLR